MICNNTNIIAEPGKASNRSARSPNAFVCMYIIYIWSQSIINTSIDCAIGKMGQPISQRFLSCENRC